MKLPSFIGLVGGKPRFAYYFVGQLEKPAGVDLDNDDDFISVDKNDQYNAQSAAMNKDNSESNTHDESDRLIFLDPHYVNPQVDFTKDITTQESLYHCKKEPRSIHMSNLDPCMSFGFLLKSHEEFLQFSNQIATGIREDGEHRIFHL